MTTLVLGAGGMVGRAMVEALGARPLVAANRAACDITAPGAAARAIAEHRARVVINCAAYTDVDAAEADEARAAEVNGHAVGALVRACDDAGATLVHLSTDYVFDGRGAAPYPVEHPASPVNAYGRSKRLGEELVLASPGAHLLVRTSWVYAPWGRNFVRTVVDLAGRRERLRVVDDQRGRPTRAAQLAARTLALLDRDARGVFHVTDAGACTWFELARHAVACAGLACRVTPCSSAAHPRPAPRPAWSVLDLSATDALIGPAEPWESSVAAVVARLRGP